ncbi:MAG: alpha/beta hydrolase, partial [Pseudomonadota bacterium]
VTVTDGIGSKTVSTTVNVVTKCADGIQNFGEDGAYNLADIWHFTGRHGVPVFYSWPAAHGGLLGYFVDSESGEYSIYHLKETIRILAAIPELENLHILAHSRGTVLVSTAIRELVIEARGAGISPRDRLKMQNVILAAPDLDFGVVQQRLAAERLETAIGHITVYTNAGDEALGLSQFLVAGLRFGRVTSNDLSDREKQALNKIRNVSFINVQGIDGFIGHSYYRTNAGALSDIATVIKDSAAPGSTQRPLINGDGNFWTLPEGYPNRGN